MDFELHPAITLGFRAFHVLVAPVQMLVEALNSHLNLQRFEVLYVCGNYSRILSGLDRRFTALEVRRAFTAFQLMTILEENRHTLLILEHDPLLYEDAREMVEYVALAMKEASKGPVPRQGLLQRTAEKRKLALRARPLWGPSDGPEL